MNGADTTFLSHGVRSVCSRESVLWRAPGSVFCVQFSAKIHEDFLNVPMTCDLQDGGPAWSSVVGFQSFVAVSRNPLNFQPCSLGLCPACSFPAAP